MSVEQPLVSVVIPAYNAANTVSAAIDSALSQTVSNIEVIVVDDQSSDTTVTVVQGITDARVRLIEREQNGRQAAARNDGIAVATGEWIAFLDADDIWLPRKLEIQLERMAAAPGCLASQAAAYLVDAQLNPLQLKRCRPDPNPLLSFLRLQNLPAAASSWIVKRELLERIGTFDTTLRVHEDWDLSLRLAQHANPICIDEPLTLYRMHGSNVSHDVDSHVACGLKILARVFADPGLSEEIRTHEREIYSRYYTMLCGGMFRVGRWRGCAYWGARALLTDPMRALYMLATPARRMRRRVAAQASPLPQP